MKLDKFIEQTLLSIVNGVTSARSKLGDSSAEIAPDETALRLSSLQKQTESNPRPQQEAKTPQDEDRTKRTKHDITFDIAVTVETGTETKGGIGAVISVFTVGATRQSDKSQTEVNRIQFTVPIMLPRN